MSRFGMALLLALGCVTSGEGDRIRADVKMLRERADANERRDAETKERLERILRALEEMSASLARQSTEVGAKVSQAENDIAQMRAQVQDLQKNAGSSEARVASLEQMQQKLVERVAPTIPKEKDQLWREAESRLSGGQRTDARRFLLAFIQRFPQDERAPQARILIGQSFAMEANHTSAVGEYVKVIDTYPQSPQVAEALWLMAQSYVEMKLCSEARTLLSDLQKRFPESRWTDEAKEKLRELQRIANDKTRCTNQ